MKRINTVLRASVGFAALVAGATAAEAQSTLPPADVTRRRQRSPDAADALGRDRHHRIAHPPRSAQPEFAGRLRRPGRLAKTGLSAIADVLQRLPSASGGLNTRSTTAATSATRLTAAASAPARRRSTCAISAPTAPWCWSTACASSTRTSASGIPGSVDLNTIPANMIDRIEVLQAGASPLYGSDAIAGVVNIITVAAAGRPARIGAVRPVPHRATARPSGSARRAMAWQLPTTTSCSAATMRSRSRSVRRPLHLAIPESRPDRLHRRRSAAAQRRRQRPLHHRFGNRQHTISRPAPDSTPTFAELRPFTSADRFNFAPFNYILTPSSVTAAGSASSRN